MPPGAGPGGPAGWGGPPVAPPPQRKRKGALIAVLSVVAVLVIGLVVGGLAWSQKKDQDKEMVPYTLSLPQKILRGDYYKKGDDSTICTDCLTSTDGIEKLGIQKGFPFAAHYVQNPANAPADTKSHPTLSVLGIEGKVTNPSASVEAALTRMHKDDTKKAKDLGVKLTVIEGTKVSAYKGDGFDGTIMKCESFMLQPKTGLDNNVMVTRCVWGDPSAVGIVQQQGTGIASHVMVTNNLTEATLLIRSEVRHPSA
ncbi:hypothetical protein [Streptomyces sp. NPDC093097]|uniref:hypothetical protein n=1 Tax=Streptomyces sp. NPDC093097 TaxID=3366027 RepID=UPI00382CAAB0